MGLSEDVVAREGIIASMEDVALKQFLFLRNLTDPILARFGERGMAALDAAFRHYGQWRGDTIRMSQSSLVAGNDALAFLANWDSCDFVLANLAAEVVVEGNSTEATVRLPRIPGSAYFKLRNGKPEVLQRYWSGLLQGMPAGYDSKLSLAVDGGAELEGPWSIRVRYGGKPAVRIGLDRVRAAIRDIFAEPARALALVRGTSRNAGALYMFIAREVIRIWDATGEQLIREGVRGIGRERGTVLREKHIREGKPLNLKSLMEDWDGPLVSTWVFNEGYLSEGAWHQDCRYCPYADAWGEFGKEGLALGLLYDIELHTTMYTTYHPGTLVRWDALKTRGDHLCKFRISIPELASPNDPEYQRPT